MLHAALSYGAVSCAEKLLHAGAAIDTADENGVNALHCAALSVPRISLDVLKQNPYYYQKKLV